MLRLYEEEGYPFVEVDPETLSLDAAGGDLSFALRVREGSRVRVRDLAVSGNRVTRARTIEREMRFRPGEVYRQSRLDRGRERLRRSGLFLQVGDAGLRPSASGREVTVVMDVVEGPTNMLEAGLGYVPPRGAQDGYLTGKVDLRLTNLAGTGRSAEVHWRRLGPASASWRLAYREPWVAGLPFALGGELRQEVRDSTYTTRGLSLTAALPLSPELDWELGAVAERTTTGARGFGYEETSRRAGAAAGLLYDRRDAVWSPRHGGFGRAQVGWARRSITRAVPEDTTLATTDRVAEATIELTTGLYLPTGPERVLALEGAWQEIVSRGVEVPVYRLYFLGGADGPRGYAEDQFAGARAGRASMEYRFLLGARSRFHFFLDLGYDEWKGASELHWGYGTGLRLESRLGLLGLDLGFPLGESLGEAKIHLRLAGEW